MDYPSLRLTKNRLYYIDHFEGEQRAHLIAMLEKYQADGIFPEIEDTAMHMAFGAVAKSIDAAKKCAATKAAKAAASMDSGASAESAGSAPAENNRTAAARTDARTASAAPSAAAKPAQAAEITAKDRKYKDFQRFYKAFPFTKKNKLGLKKAYEMWIDFDMDAEPIEVVLKALNRDKGRGKFNRHAPSLHQWLCGESWAA
ncbi:MAG: hypothetical protein LBR73_04405 [Oscillospiraceae bacterium]|nr:hypothetical protein [Oscillospiraceae bacterium]